MKVDVTQNLLDLDGKPMLITFQQCPMCGRPLEEKGVRTLRNAITDALSVDYQDEQRGGGLSGPDKFKRHCLARKVHNNDEPELIAEEVVLLKNVVAKRFPPAVMGPVWLLLDPVELEADDDR